VAAAAASHVATEVATVSQTPPVQLGTAAPAAVQAQQEVSQPTAIDLVASFVVQNHLDWAAEAVLLAVPEALRDGVVTDGPCTGPDPSGALLDRIQAKRTGTVAAPSVVAQSFPCSSGILQMQPLVATFSADNLAVPSVSPPDAISDFIAQAGLDASCEKLMRSLEQGLAERVMAKGPLHGNRLAAALSGRIRHLRNSMAIAEAPTTGYVSSMQLSMHTF